MKNYILLSVMLFYGFVFCGDGKTDLNVDDIREPAFAGQFYPSESAKLNNAVDFFLHDARKVTIQQPLGIIVPHAGYIYSGQVAADAYKNIQEFDYDLIVILGTNHTSATFKGNSIYPGDGFKTPLGVIQVDTEFSNKLRDKNDNNKFDNTLHEREHSIEVQLPFIQKTLPDAKIVAIIVSTSSEESCKQLANDLVELSKYRKVLFIASSDLSHYPKFDDALKIDKNTCNTICNLETESFFKKLDQSVGMNYPGLSTCACGEAPILTLMHAMKLLGIQQGQIISYMNSGFNPIGKNESVVGYTSIVFSSDSKNTPCDDFNVTEPGTEFNLTSTRKSELLRLARNTIDFFLNSEMLPCLRNKDSFFNFKRGAFVTLHKNGQLRGCIGHMAEDMTLSKVVQLMAIQSALYDRRFPQVTAEEVNELEIEISILTPYQKISDIDEITLGTDGVVLQKSNFSSVYLPQVANETGWSKKQFLEQLSLKAGLDKDAYRDAELFTFQALVFSEKDTSGK